MCQILPVEPKESERFFDDLVMISYSHKKINGVEAVYCQSSVLCKYVSTGIYSLKAAVSLLNPKIVGNYLLIVVKEESVKFTGCGKTFRGRAITELTMENIGDSITRLIGRNQFFRVTLHRCDKEEEVFNARVEFLSQSGEMQFKEEGSGNEFKVNLLACDFIRMQLL